MPMFNSILFQTYFYVSEQKYFSLDQLCIVYIPPFSHGENKYF